MLNCKKCGKEIPNDSKICPYCGKKVNKENNSKKIKKIISGVVIAIAIVVVVVVGINFIKDRNELVNDVKRAGSEEGRSHIKEQTENLDKKLNGEDKEEEDESVTSKYQKKFTLTEYKTLCKTIPYKDLSRTPDTYKLENLYFKGKVIQVVEDTKEGLVQLRIDTKMSNYEYVENDYTDDTIYVIIDKYDKNNRILEDDIVEIWGVYTGIFTYESVMGNEVSLPALLGVYWNIIK